MFQAKLKSEKQTTFYTPAWVPKALYFRMGAACMANWREEAHTERAKWDRVRLSRVTAAASGDSIIKGSVSASAREGTREGGVGCIARIGLALRLSGAATLGPRASSGVDHSGTHSSWFWEGTKMASDKNALFQENKIPPPTLKGYILRRPRAPQNLLLKWKDDAEK